MELVYDSDYSDYDDEHERKYPESQDGENRSVEEDDYDDTSSYITQRAAHQFRSRNLRRREKTAYLEKNASLTAQRSNLERDIRLQFFDTKIAGLRQAAAQASTDSLSMELSFQKESKSLSSQLIEFRSKTSKLRKQLQHLIGDQANDNKGGLNGNDFNGDLKDNDIESLHMIFDHLESDISTFKRKGRSRYQELQQKEKKLNKELQDFQLRCENWDTEVSSILRDASKFCTPPSKKSGSSSSGGSRKMTKTSSSRPNSRPSIIVDIEREMEHIGGPTGGWDARDHATFLRLLSKYNLRSDAPTSTITTSCRSTASSPGTATHPDVYRRIQSMLSFALTKLPSYDTSQVKSHWKWYQKYTSLVDQKRRAVKEWRDSKKHSSMTPPCSNLSPSNYLTPEQKRTKINNRKLASLEKLRLESEKKKKQLQEWKKAKAREKRLKEEEEEQKLLKEKQRRLLLREERNILKEEIALYRLQREAEEAHQEAVQKVLATARGHVRGPPTSSEVIRKRYARDMRKIEEKKEKKRNDLLLQKEKEKKRLEITRKVNSKVLHDFNRLTRHTTASAHNSLTPETLDELEAKRKAQHGGHNGKLYGHTGAELSRGRTYAMSKASTLKVPSWRRLAK